MTEPPPEESLPTTADARAAATALSSLSTHLSADDPQPNIDREALGKAMSRLEGGEDKQQDGGEAGDGEREKKKVGAAVVRVEGADVALL
ncbi:hypothetical protein MMC12_008636, partial [Toensbergia leucococca]|nr:hypothetical protein [Toensbergia leucococca]